MGAKKLKMDDAAQVLKGARAAVTEALTLLDRAVSAVRALDAELNGGRQILADAIQHWGLVWGARYQGSKYAWINTKDTPALRRLVLQLGADEVKGRMSRFLMSDEAFYRKASHSFQMFVATINTWVAPASLHTGRPPNCTHEPACVSDSACTRRALDDWQNS